MHSIARFLRTQHLVRLFLVHALIGYAISTAFVGSFLIFDIGGLATLVAVQNAQPAMLLLWFFVGLTFASVQMGMAVMSLADPPPPGGGKRVRVAGAPAAARISAAGR